MKENEPGRGLECDCGFVAHGENDDELVAAVQEHALAVHGMILPADLILTLSSRNGSGPDRHQGKRLGQLSSRSAPEHSA